MAWSPAKKNVLVFDLETQKLAAEVGGFENADELGLSLGVTQHFATKKFRTYREDEAAALVEHLCEAHCVVGYNLHGFDYKVLGAYTRRVLGKLPTVDIADQIYNHLGFGVKFDSVCKENLGDGKSGDGIDAVALYRAGRVQDLERYAKKDVELTRKLYALALKQGSLKVWTRTGVVEVPIDCAPVARLRVTAPKRIAPKAVAAIMQKGGSRGRAAPAIAGPCSNCGSFNHVFDGSGITCDEDYFASKDD